MKLSVVGDQSSSSLRELPHSSRDKGVTAEENVLTYWQDVEGAEGWDPAWDLISFKINQPIK